uniref:MYB20 n=1 Tax=Arundo donax TaxID=35708 RepID=A0A0A9HF24_ARUDO
MWVFQWFLISLSVLPGRCDAILDHRLPSSACRSITVFSSSSDSSPRFRSGRK